MNDINDIKVNFRLSTSPVLDKPDYFTISFDLEQPDFEKYVDVSASHDYRIEQYKKNEVVNLRITLKLKEFFNKHLPNNESKILEILNYFVVLEKLESTETIKIMYQLLSYNPVTLIENVFIPKAAEAGSTLNDSSAAPVPSKLYKIKNPITLQRTVRPLTGDVALWLMIKMNADNLGWSNYKAQLELLFGSDPQNGSGIYDGAQRLSRRRFLPFTDTDAYRTLKVATEAFVVTWGGVVPAAHESELIGKLIQQDTTAIKIASERLGIDINQVGLVREMVEQYFGTSFPPTIPYLTRVVQGLRETGAESSVQAAIKETRENANENSREYPGNGQGNNCGETCLWLAHLNQDYSAKLARPPLIELIWSYWMEEMQLVQTMNAISRRFQNVSSGPRDPMAQFELDAVRPLNNMIWGWVQDEQHRLPIERRAAEYQHEYGFQLFGRAVPITHAADVRSRFLAAFHTLLNQCVPFFRQADDTTVVPDAFPLLNALREVHLILSEGAHNQFLDLPSTSRIEMMMQQWILARPEFREFLPRRAMIAYPEPWMHSVESMRKLQGWGDTNTYQFWQLATTGEQIVSSIRWGNWNSIEDPINAANWAAFFRPDIQTYIHSYRAVTGIDVSAEPVDVQVPGMHLMRRLQEQQRIKVEHRSTAP